MKKESCQKRILDFVFALVLLAMAPALTHAQSDTACNELCRFIKQQYEAAKNKDSLDFYYMEFPDSLIEKYLPNFSYNISTNYPCDNLILAMKDGNYMFFDLCGLPIIPDQFTEINFADQLLYSESFCESWFYNGLLAVKSKKGSAILREDFTYAVPFGQYERISSQTTSGLFIVSDHNQYGIINTHLDTLYPIVHQNIHIFNNLMESHPYEWFTVTDDDKIHIIDTHFQRTSDLQFDNVVDLSLNRGYAYIQDTLFMIDAQGKVFRPDFQTILHDLGQGLLVVKKDGKPAVVDSDYKEIIPAVYDHISTPSEYYNPIFYVENNKKWALFDNSGEPITDFVYDWIEETWDPDTMNFLVVKDDKFGKIDETGNEIIPCIYDAISSRWHLFTFPLKGHYVVKDNLTGYVDNHGVRIPAAFDAIQVLKSERWAVVIKDRKLGIWDLKEDSLAVPVQYRYIFSESAGDTLELIVNDHGHWKMIDQQNQILDNPEKLRTKMKEYHLRRHQYFNKRWFQSHSNVDLYRNRQVHVSRRVARAVKKSFYFKRRFGEKLEDYLYYKMN